MWWVWWLVFGIFFALFALVAALIALSSVSECQRCHHKAMSHHQNGACKYCSCDKLAFSVQDAVYIEITR